MANIDVTQVQSYPKLDGTSCTCSCCREIAQLQLDMLESKRSLNEMKNRQRTLNLEKNQTHSLINKRMPPEILSTIFVYCLPTPRQLEYGHEYERGCDLFNPTILGHICRGWRDIAWSTPRLWCQLFFLFRTNEPHRRASLVADLAREWLDRSAKLPLSLYIRMNKVERHHHFNPQDCLVLEVVARYSQRWQDLYLKMSQYCISELGDNITELPLLHTYKIWAIDVNSNPEWWDVPIKPRRVEFRPQFLDEPTSNFFDNIDWNCLNEVVVDGLLWADYIQILKSASRMTRFTMDTGLVIEPLSPSLSIVHVNLRYFKVCGQPTRSFQQFVSALDFPSLTELHYDVGGHARRRPTRLSECHYPDILFQRLRGLKSLSIQLSLSLESDRYIDILKRWPSLNELFLIDRDKYYPPQPFDPWGPSMKYWVPNTLPPPPTPLLSYFAETYMNNASAETCQTFLPSLHKLGYRGMIDGPPWDAIVNTLGPLRDINNPHRRPLRELNIEFAYGGGIEPLVARRLWEAKKAGVDITLKDDDWYDEMEETNTVFSSLMKEYDCV